MQPNRHQLLAKVAYLYYEKDYTQSQIAKQLNIYRTTISRMLKQARETGIVEIKINDFNSDLFNLEEALKQRYGLQNAIVIATEPHASSERKEQLLSAEAALYLKQTIKPHNVVGFAWGSILSGMVGQLHHPIQTDATFVPLVGGPSPSNSQYHVNGIVYDAARVFGGRSLFVDAAAVQESKYIRDGIMASKYFHEIQDCWEHLDIALLGIGGPLNNTSSRWRDLLTPEDRELLKERQAIGDCCCTFFDKNGKILAGNLLDRTISIPLPQLTRVPNAIAIARSLTKAPSILALLKMGILTTLITDAETAQRVLDLDD
ncbi:sugar-binding transcriptional regulator [Lactiplantibacillus garii]|uniref:Sugar-binding transcriptional regulator n=1 Tax=Lactiplantibacillus garii TaxID=2306423 RepID=A0A426D609_9LACO|nr:sugar-binding transcriptional regulator [Lactiplantibacillus garii]RRK10086.1 sugar-binding transcriptional regulator [Lactiplantibacillus garii]